jgi:hypothetical protein
MQMTKEASCELRVLPVRERHMMFCLPVDYGTDQVVKREEADQTAVGAHEVKRLLQVRSLDACAWYKLYVVSVAGSNIR